jgi:DNA polymerase III delta prime subunit
MYLKNLNHHAILIEGNPSVFLDMIKNEFIESGVVLANNPDIIFLSFEKFGIGESRQIIDMSLGAPISSENKTIVFSFESITNDAQNALLKIFEDPSPSLKFIISTYTANGLLPTLRSRLAIYKNEKETEIVNVDSFIKMSVGEKMKEVERMVKNYKDSGNKQEIKQFLTSIHYYLEEKIKKGEKGHNLSALNMTARALDYIDDKSASVKILLESVVLSIVG